MAAPKQQLFLTGASGYIGSVVAELALAQGYSVHALSRSESSDIKLQSLGVVPVRGDLTSLDALRKASAGADLVIHLATAYALGDPSYDDIMPVDVAAVDAIADGLAGTNKPLVIAAGTLSVAADPTGAETTEASPLDPDPINTRVKFEAYSLGLVSRGIRVISVRLAPFVYGRAGSGVKLFMTMSAPAGAVTYVAGGQNRTTVVHVDDAAQLCLLAAQKGGAGEVYNAGSDTTVAAHQLFGAIAAVLGVPLRDVTFKEATAQLGEAFARFLSAENRASGAKAVEQLGWQPKSPGILEDISSGSYKAFAAELKNSSA